jgi:3-methyladenine DNA glycosylase AlkD
MNANKAGQELRKYASNEKANILSRFFKTGPGQYGEGDIFMGVMVPDVRKVAKNFCGLPQKETLKLLHSPIHEERLLALFLLVEKYQSGNAMVREKIVRLYLANTRFTNNWDLVDLSAYKILGNWLLDKRRAKSVEHREERPAASSSSILRSKLYALSSPGRPILYTLVRSANLWERRIAIIATFAFIREKDFKDAFRIAGILMQDKEDLIHKAVGWMLRETGKRDMVALETYLKKRYTQMPRTMLRYAIEKFPEKKRKAYLRGEV